MVQSSINSMIGSMGSVVGKAFNASDSDVANQAIQRVNTIRQAKMSIKEIHAKMKSDPKFLASYNKAHPPVIKGGKK